VQAAGEFPGSLQPRVGDSDDDVRVRT
jgi:hypothetical protein